MLMPWQFFFWNKFKSFFNIQIVLKMLFTPDIRLLPCPFDISAVIVSWLSVVILLLSAESWFRKKISSFRDWKKLKAGPNAVNSRHKRFINNSISENVSFGLEGALQKCSAGNLRRRTDFCSSTNMCASHCVQQHNHHSSFVSSICECDCVHGTYKSQKISRTVMSPLRME